MTVNYPGSKPSPGSYSYLINIGHHSVTKPVFKGLGGSTRPDGCGSHT